MRRDGLPRVRSFAANSTQLRRAREFVRERAVLDRVPDELAEELVLAVTEAFSNAVAHSESMLVFVSWWVGERDVEVQVMDDGLFEEILPVQRDSGGIGMALMMMMVDEFAIRRGTEESPGTLVRLRKRVGREVGPLELVVVPDSGEAEGAGGRKAS